MAGFTEKDVEIWLVAGFRAMSQTGVVALPNGGLSSTDTKMTPSATFDILAFSATVLGARSDERKAVLAWAKWKALKVGYCVADYCLEVGWSRPKFERLRRRACVLIADAKNAADAFDAKPAFGGLTVIKPGRPPVSALAGTDGAP